MRSLTESIVSEASTSRWCVNTNLDGNTRGASWSQPVNGDSDILVIDIEENIISVVTTKDIVDHYSRHLDESVIKKITSLKYGESYESEGYIYVKIM